MNVRELHERLANEIHDGNGDCEVVVCGRSAGRPVRLVEVRNAKLCGQVYEYGLRYGVISRVVRISSR